MNKKTIAGVALALGIGAMFPFASLKAASQYALGDVNKDGSVTKADAIKIIRMLQGEGFTVDQYMLADYNQDNELTYKDAYDLMKDIDETYMLGDANKDGKLSLDDNEVIKATIMSQSEGTLCTDPEKLMYEDFDMDGEIHSMDYVKLKNVITGATEYFQYGDATLDARVNKKDALRIIEIYKGATATDMERKYADYNRDGVIDIKDAQELMQANDPTYKLGDINSDGIVTKYDTLLLLRIFGGTKVFETEAENLLYADLNQDGIIDAKDTIASLRKLDYDNGDINFDGKVDEADGIRVVEIYKGAECTEAERYQADYIGDNEIDMVDAQELMKDYVDGFKVGDADGDGIITKFDSLIILRVFNGNYNYGSEAKTLLHLDMNQNGMIDMMDTVLALRAIDYADGDINLDGVVDEKDAIRIAEIVLGSPATDVEKAQGDFNGNGRIDIKDAHSIMEAYFEDYVLGDADGDGVYTEADADIIFNVLAENPNPDFTDRAKQLVYLDVDEDGKITGKDYNMVYASIAIKGDLNNDKKVNSTDAALALKIYQRGDATEDELLRGDLNGDGKVNSSDATAILKIYASNN